MGIGGILKKVAQIGLPIAGAVLGGPIGAKLGVTAGGLLSGIGGAASALAPVLGGAAGQREESKRAGINDQMTRDQINLRSAESKDRSILDRAGMDLKRKQFGLDAPAQRMDNAARGSILQRAQPIRASAGSPMTLGSGRSVTPVNFRGFDPSLIGPQARELGGMVEGQMLEDQRGGDEFAPMDKVAFPGATPDPGSNFGDKLLGGAAFGTSVAGALAKQFPRKPKPVVPPYEEPTIFGSPM